MKTNVKCLPPEVKPVISEKIGKSEIWCNTAMNNEHICVKTNLMKLYFKKILMEPSKKILNEQIKPHSRAGDPKNIAVIRY